MNNILEFKDCIVEGLVQNELAVITNLQKLGNSISVSFINKNNNITDSKIIQSNDLDKLILVSRQGEFNFKGDPVKFKLFAEAERINTAYQFDPLYAVNCSIVEPLPHQVDAVYKYLLPQPKIRFLLADDTGAGKTIMTGLLIKELQLRKLINRILIITPGGLTKQWQEDELGIKFNFNFKLVNRSILNSEPNIFKSSDKIVTSIDFISREDVIKIATDSSWDLIVFDEAHKLSAYDYGSKIYKSRRYEAASQLAQNCDHLLLLTATPHRGRKDTFKKLLQLLDEDIFSTDELVTTRINEIETNGRNRFFIRRLKESMTDWNGFPLFKNRHTKTTSYNLTPEEKNLYDQVTKYLSVKKEEAKESKNIHVTLALSVMQRRLVSSIYALKNTLLRRYNSLQGIVDELNKNPNLWKQKQKLEEYDVDNLDQFEDLDDEDKESLENIMSDPKKFKLFTTAKDINEIKEETREVKRLYEMANSLYLQNQEEQKFKVLGDLLKSEKVIDGEKLVIFTEHKDTLIYLEERLRNSGYNIATIHGGKSVDERREAQFEFAKPDTQILIATDAAGEGINLQFCRLLINWDIPWNPNRLEQRMGRIHRYGQQKDVLVFNMVASNTKEGQVLEKLLRKIDIIRESIGDDRVYDVIQDVLEEVDLDDIYESVLEGKETVFSKILDESENELQGKFREKIKEQKESLTQSNVDYADAKKLKENSDEKRLQPIYIRKFFEQAFTILGGGFEETKNSIFSINSIPQEIIEILKQEYNIFSDIRKINFCFDKKIFWDYQNIKDIGNVHYINPGNPLFDSIVKVVRNKFLKHMIMGTILISPEDKNESFVYLAKSQISNNTIADELLFLVYANENDEYISTSPSKLIDLYPPVSFSKDVKLPSANSNEKLAEWVFTEITEKQFEEVKSRIESDSVARKEFMETAFREMINKIQTEINELQSKIFVGDSRIQEKIDVKQKRVNELLEKREKRRIEFEQMKEIYPKHPEILGCAYVVPLSKVEYHNRFGMSRDDEAEKIAMSKAMEYEIESGWYPEDVSAENEGYDIRSTSPEKIKRYIEVKGRNMEEGVMLSENEMNRLSQLGDSAWLYIVVNCKSNPELFRIQNPANSLIFEKKSKGIQYFVQYDEWKKKIVSS